MSTSPPSLRFCMHVYEFWRRGGKAERVWLTQSRCHYAHMGNEMWRMLGVGQIHDIPPQVVRLVFSYS